MATAKKAGGLEKVGQDAGQAASQSKADPNTDPGKPDEGSDAPPVHVRMKRHSPQHPGGPVTAKVHQDEIDNYARHGWVVDEE